MVKVITSLVRLALQQQCGQVFLQLHYQKVINITNGMKMKYSSCFLWYQERHYSVKSATKMVSRPKTKRPIKSTNQQNEAEKTCLTYATADQYSFTKLVDYIKQDLRVSLIKLPPDIVNAVLFKTEDDALLQSNGTGYFLIFRYGTISFWNISQKAVKELKRIVQKFEIEPYPIQLISWESEEMNYQMGKVETKFTNRRFEMCQHDDETTTGVELYTFSNALATSVKLAHWEHALDDLVRSLDSLPQELIRSRLPVRYRTSKSMLRQIGKVFLIRHQINLQHNLLDVPDVYWDRDNLEQLYVQTTEYLNISRRVHIINEKLSYCLHMIELVKSHVAEQKSLRVEILIVVLILIEVLFEIIHFWKQGSNT